MPTVRGITAHVVCDGKALEEHSARIDPANEHEVSCWIASESEQAFEIECNWETETEWDWSIKIDCDEVFKRNKFISHLATTAKITRMIDGLSWRRMVFADISPQDLVLGEATKAFDPERRGGALITEILDEHAYVTFKFLYRSKEVLQALGILPPAEAPLQQRENRQQVKAEIHPQEDTKLPIKRSASAEPSYMDIVDRERELEFGQAELARVRETKRRKLEGSSSIKREVSPILMKGSGSKGRSKQDAIIIESDGD
ncbi:hypothetical protein FRC17_006030 [Serendipita sp. 399]|nr:hypothetical protein FRC17_006030 [Serendipita sp. 399]